MTTLRRLIPRAGRLGRRIVRRGLSAVGVVAPAERRHRVVCANGRTLIVDLADGRGAKLRATSGNANPPSLAAWLDVLDSRRWDVVLDIGSNYGEMLVNADLSPHGTVIAVEPNPSVCSCLIETIALNQLPVLVCTAALGDRHDIAEMDASSPNSGAALVRSLDSTEAAADARILTTTTTVDALLAALEIPVAESAIAIKIDVEGFEPQVLQGAEEVLSTAPHVVIMTEVLHGEAIPKGFDVVERIASESHPDLVQDVILERSRGPQGSEGGSR